MKNKAKPESRIVIVDSIPLWNKRLSILMKARKREILMLQDNIAAQRRIYTNILTERTALEEIENSRRGKV